jgi:hypothetical protein
LRNAGYLMDAVAGCKFVPYTRAPHRPDKSAESDFIRDWEARIPIEALAALGDFVVRRGKRLAIRKGMGSAARMRRTVLW